MKNIEYKTSKNSEFVFETLLRRCFEKIEI